MMLSTIMPSRPSQPAKSNSNKNTRACREQNGSMNVVWRVQQAFPQTDRHGLLQTSRPWQLGGLDHIDVAAWNRATMTTHLRTRCGAFSGPRRARRITAPCARPLGPSRGCADHKCAQCARQRRCDGLRQQRLMIRQRELSTQL